MNNKDKFFTPVFEREGNLFVIVSQAFICPSEYAAQVAGVMGEMTIGAAITGCAYTDEVIEVDGSQRNFALGQWGGVKVAVLSGPIYRAAKARALKFLEQNNIGGDYAIHIPELHASAQ